jgi:hypothetical protein
MLIQKTHALDRTLERKLGKDSFAPLDGTEYAMAISAILGAGYEPAEFALEERRSDLRAAGGSVRTYKLVSVKRLTVGYQRQYNSGPGGGWPYEFERDLRLHVYGPPTANA